MERKTAILMEINMHPRLLRDARPSETSESQLGKRRIFPPSSAAPSLQESFLLSFYRSRFAPTNIFFNLRYHSASQLPPPFLSSYPFIYASLHVLPLTFAYVCRMHYAAVLLDFKGNVANFRKLDARQSPVGSHLTILQQIYRWTRTENTDIRSFWSLLESSRNSKQIRVWQKAEIQKKAKNLTKKEQKHWNNAKQSSAEAEAACAPEKRGGANYGQVKSVEVI